MTLENQQLTGLDRARRPAAPAARGERTLTARCAHAALARLLRRVIRTGHLTVIAPDGAPITAGESAASGGVTVRIRDWRTLYHLVTDPDLALGEGYMDGAITVEAGEISDLLDLVGRNLETDGGRPSSIPGA